MSVRNKFGAVDTGVWKHQAFKGLDDDSKLLFLYLKTCEHQNMIGCFHLPVLYMCADLKWTEQKINKTLSKLFDKGFASVDKRIEYVLLNKHLCKHPLQNSNQAKGAYNLFDNIPKDFKYIKEIAKILLNDERVAELFSNPLLTVCNSVSVSVSVSVSESVSSFVGQSPTDDAKECIDYLNKKTQSNYAQVDSNISPLLARFKEGHTVDDVINVIDSKHDQWNGTKQEMYLRPKTLFSASNFNNYIGQVGKVTGSKSVIDQFANGGSVVSEQ